MINSIINLLIILTFQQQKSVKSAVGIQQRLQILKHEIQSEIQNEPIRIGTQPSGAGVLDDFYKFIGKPPDDGPIKPITQYFDKKKHKHKHHIGKATNMTAPKYKHRLRTRTNTSIHTTKTTTIRHTTSKITPADVYIRRFIDEEEMNKPVKWAHCVHLITPYLKRYNDRVTFQRVGVKDGTVIRLTQLLSMNTSMSTKEEIVSIIYQISNLQIKIFNWDVNAITTLFNVIIPEPNHSFRNLKAGLKRIFSRWHLDLSNITTFRDQTQIFRPPCIKLSEFGGSTKSPKRHLKYTKRTTKDSDDDEDCD